MSSIDLYLYYGGEPRSDVIHGVMYEGSGKRLEIIQLKKWQEISLKKLKKKITKVLNLDCWFHDITIIYCALHAVFSVCIVYMPTKIKGEKHVKIMFDRINSTPQSKVAKLYIHVEPRTEVSGEYVQQIALEGGGGKNYNHYTLMVIQLLLHAPQLGVRHYHVMRHQLQ